MLLCASISMPANAQSLYDRVLEQAKEQNPQLELEDPILKFSLLQTQQKYPDTTEDDIKNSVGDNKNVLCKNALCDPAKSAQQNSLLPVASRTLARELTIIAKSYENGIVGMTGEPKGIATKWPSISAIWQSGHDVATAPNTLRQVRTIAIPNNIERALENALNNAFSGFSRQEIASAAFVYRHGVRDYLNAGDCDDTQGDTTDFWQTQRFCDLETTLADVLSEIQSLTIDPSLKPGELAVVPSISDAENDIYLWARFDDIGFSTIFGTEAIHTAYSNDDELILAEWDYAQPPEEPGLDEGICSHPFGKRGYLCRPVSAQLCPFPESGCAIDPDTGDCYDKNNSSATGAVLAITTCEKQDFRDMISYSESGPNVCQIGGWLEQIDPNEDELEANIQPYLDTDPEENTDILEELNECSDCVIDLYCDDTCGSNGEDGAFTFQKTPEGLVKICIPNGGPTENGLSEYLAIHEVVHAQQMCNIPSDVLLFDTRETCCAKERDAYNVMCNALYEDGILEAAGISIDTCASQFANLSCSSYGTDTEAACTTTKDIGLELLGTLTGVTLADINGPNNFKLKTDCKEIIEELDKRAVSQIMSTTKVCNPNCAVKYKNTIGNNLCYVGQCIEQSVEEHRLTPGRWTNGVQDEAFPWDACMQPDPEIASVVPITPDNLTRLPAYEPQRIMDLMDAQLCEQNGFPRLTPPVLCTFNSNTFLQSTQNAQSAFYLERNIQQDEDAAIISSLSRELTGGRIGTSIFKNYLDSTIPYFNEILQTVRDLLEQIGETSFPTEMCPRDAPEDCSDFARSSAGSTP